MNKILVRDAYRIAIHEIGVIEAPGDANNPRIIEYHSSCSAKFTSDSVPWCSAFVNWCVQKAGGLGTRSAMARSWLNWGKKIDKPFEGCIAVFERGTDGVSGHVAFFVRESKNNIWVLGGNQGNEVDINAYSKRRLLGYRSSLDTKLIVNDT